MSKIPLMPKATAVWLVDNTALTFDQISEFCKIHRLEVKAIADGESAQGIKGLDPISTGQLTRDELKKAQENPNHKLRLSEPKVVLPKAKRRGPRYTPLSKRQDRPNAIYWLVKNHPELKDSQIIRLVGTTKNTIEAIRSGSHWNASNLTPMDPVTLGLCTQISLDFEVEKSAKYRPLVEESVEEDVAQVDPGLKPVEHTQSQVFGEPTEALAATEEEEIDADKVFDNFTNLQK